MNSLFEETKKTLKENNIPFSTIGDQYILVEKEHEEELYSLLDENLIVTNDPNTILILPYVYEEESDVYETLQYCGLYTGQ